MGDSVRARNVMLGVITFVVVIWFLRVSWVVTMPLALAMFLAAVLWPVLRALERRLPRWLAIAGTLLTLAVGVAAIIAALGFGMTQATALGPQYAEKIRSQFHSAMQWANDRGLPISQDSLTDEAAVQNALGWIGASLTSIWTALGLLALAGFLLILLISEIGQWRQKAMQAARGSSAGSPIFESVNTIVDQLHSYMLIRTVISLVSGALAWIWCLILGIDLAFVWGLLTFLLNYLPNIGSLISFIPPTLLSLMQYDLKWAAVTFACLSITDAIIGNIIDPLIQGRSLRLSPLVVLVAVVFWGWVWGIAGAVLGVPMTASLAIICNHVDALRPIGRFLSTPGPDRKTKRSAH